MQLVPRKTLIAFLLALLTGICVRADSRQPRMGIFTRPDARIDTSLSFTDSVGERRTLASMVVSDKPFVLVPVFYQCPRLCGLTISGVVDLVNHLPLSLGKDYSLVVYSFNPRDTLRDAADKRSKMLERLTVKNGLDSSVHFLIGDEATVSRLNDQLGFRVRYADKELEHSSAIFIVTPQGEVRRYFAGVEFDPKRVASALAP